jgi:excisionase family DNA binding protein
MSKDSEKQPQEIYSHWMDVSDVARYLKCKERHIRELVYRREIPFCKVGRLLRFHRKEIDRWLLNKG